MQNYAIYILSAQAYPRKFHFQEYLNWPGSLYDGPQGKGCENFDIITFIDLNTMLQYW